MQGNKKLTICRLIFGVAPPLTGGSVVHTIELAQHINPYCKKQFLIVPKADVDTTDLDNSFRFKVYRVNYFKFKWLHRLKAKYLKWLPLAPLVVLSYGFFALPQIFRLNRKYGIDVIHAHGISTGIIATIAGKLSRKPVVWMIDGTQEAYSETAGKYESVVTKLFPPDHALVVDDGSPARQKFTKLLNGKVTVVYHGVDFAIFRPNPPNKELLHHLGLQVDNFVIISAHSLIPIKGIEHAISAFGEFLKISGASNTILLIAGGGSLTKQLEEMAHNLGIAEKVLFLGAIDNSQIPDYLAISNIAVATSTYSNVNRSVQEAMACGKPVVVFNSGGTDKVIQHMETGILTESGNVRDLAEKMLVLHQNPELRTKIGENARRFIMQNRNWDSRINVELQVYRNLLEAKGK